PFASAVVGPPRAVSEDPPADEQMLTTPRRQLERRAARALQVEMARVEREAAVAEPIEELVVLDRNDGVDRKRDRDRLLRLRTGRLDDRFTVVILDERIALRLDAPLREPLVRAVAREVEPLHRL